MADRMKSLIRENERLRKKFLLLMGKSEERSRRADSDRRRSDARHNRLMERSDKRFAAALEEVVRANRAYREVLKEFPPSKRK